jgi:hypothetical protein
MTITGHQYSRDPHRVLLLTLLALGALGLVACGGGDDDETTTEVGLSREQRIEQEIERTGNRWAPLFAAARDRAACRYQTQPLCERIDCERVSTGTIRNCTPPSSAFRESFADATVEDVAVVGEKAGARFSNGEAVELDGPTLGRAPVPGDVWQIHKVGGNAGDVEFITKVGNAWAPLFAEDYSAACEFMFGQPLCEEFFGQVGEPPEVGRPSAFQRSFANATVERVEVKDARQIKAKDGTPIEMHRAAAEFSNGEVVEFIQETQRPPRAPEGTFGDWFVDDVGGKEGS